MKEFSKMGLSDGDGDDEPGVMQEVQPGPQLESLQHVVVMRHGDRIDKFEPMWEMRASRPWDPPLTQDGKDRAFARGRKFRTHFQFPIHRVFVSPFLRCLQTAAEVIHGLCAVNDHDPVVTSSAGITNNPSKFKFPIHRVFVSPFLRCLQTAAEVIHGPCAVNDHDPAVTSSAGITIDPSKIKVSVEYGLCEMLNAIAIRPKVAPKDHDFGFIISEYEAHLPAGTVDHSVEGVQEMPKWGESVLDAQDRYASVIRTLADKYPLENLLLVTHGVGVGSSVSNFSDTSVSFVDYCGYSLMTRSISSFEDQSFTAGDFRVHVMVGENGLSYVRSSNEPDAS